jgi:hypothetical protein
VTFGRLLFAFPEPGGLAGPRHALVPRWRATVLRDVMLGCSEQTPRTPGGTNQQESGPHRFARPGANVL